MKEKTRFRYIFATVLLGYWLSLVRPCWYRHAIRMRFYCSPV